MRENSVTSGNINTDPGILKAIGKLHHLLLVDDHDDALVKPIDVSTISWKMGLFQDLSKLTLLAYILLIFNPVVPVFADMLAHTFWEEEHLATEHYLYGSDHVDFEINKLYKQESKEKSTASYKALEDFSHILVFQKTADFIYYDIIRRNYPPYQMAYSSSCPDKDYPPPKV